MVLAIPRVQHLILPDMIVNLEDVYGDAGTILGISKLEEEPPENARTYKSPVFLCSSGIIRLVKVYLDNKKTRTMYVIAANAPKIGAIVGKEYQSGINIKRAWFPGTFKYG